MSSSRMPSITEAQIIAVLGWVAAQAVAWGVIDDVRAQTLVSVGATVIAAALKLADAYLRAHRALAVAQNPAIVHPPANQPASSPDPPAPAQEG